MSWDPSPAKAVLGDVQIIITGLDGLNHDITALNGIPALIKSVVSNEPFGDASATIDFKQITPYISPRRIYGLFPNLEIFIVAPGNTTKYMIFQGFVSAWEYSSTSDDWTTLAQCKGALYQYDLYKMFPPIYVASAPEDIGRIIKDTMDSVKTKVLPLAPVTTGIQTFKTNGAGQPILTGFIQDVLSTASTAEGQQWTLMLQDVYGSGRQPILRLKDMSTIHWTMACGAPGVVHDLALDFTTGTTTFYGEGIDVFGCYWRNTKYPNLHADTAPVFTSPVILTIGTTNAESNGDVSIWQRQAGTAVTGTFNANDRARAITIQQNAGLQVDGNVGAQTWAATFNPGSNQGSLDGAYYAPLYSDPRTTYYRYNANGDRIGLNPQYDPSVDRVETWTNYGVGISKQQAIQMARIQYNRDRNPAWMGTITLTSDPNENSRFLIRPGQNFLYQGFGGNQKSGFGHAPVSNLSITQTPGMALNEPIVDAVQNPANPGYWMVAGDGGVFSFNGAQFHGSLAGRALSAPIVGIAATPAGGGYWLAGADGGVFAENNGQPFGNAVFPTLGSLPARGEVPSGPIVGIAASGQDNQSYWLADSKGGVHSFGHAVSHGSMIGQHLNAPIVDIKSTMTGNGYWLVAADGGVFAFGDAPFLGSLAGTQLAAGITGMTPNVFNNGYYLVGGDGGVFAFGSIFFGSLGGSRPAEQIVAIIRGDSGLNYRIIGADGATWLFLDTPSDGPTDPTAEGVFFHISQVEKNFEDMTVTLTVDEKARDLMTLSSVYERNRQANDPALRPQPYHMNSTQTFDNTSVFDCESGAGIIPYQAIQAGLWNVIHIPAAATGVISQMSLTADDTTAKLSMGVFDQPLTASDLVQYGNPLTNTNFWTNLGENHGLIIGWGSADQPGGYSPGALANGDPPTGKIIDNASWYYLTKSSPWLWIALYSNKTTFVQGRLLPVAGTG